MGNPFPGMNPYLEDANLWPVLHRELVASLEQQLGPGLANRYYSQIGQRRYSISDPPTLSGEQQTHKAEFAEEFIEIRNRQDGSLVTLVEVLSPANKTTSVGRAPYLEKRKEALAEKAGVVEVDLVLQGQPTFPYSRDGLPEFDYSVTVIRGTSPERYEIYTASLDKRLPKFKVPLAADDRDALIDLQEVFARAFDRGNFDVQIDYDRDPPIEVVSHYAYRIWEREACLHGRDKDHWYRAIADLKGKAPGMVRLQ
jgi:hypothetical protein